MGLTDVILLGAGSGTRYSHTFPGALQSAPKQFQEIEGKPVFIWSLLNLVQFVPTRKIWIVVSPEHTSLTHRLCGSFLPADWNKKIQVILGGSSRQESSFNALEAIAQENPLPDKVLIHDACRPFISRSLGQSISSHLNLSEKKGYIPAIAVTETLKSVENETVQKTVERKNIYRVQTPQIFCFRTLRHCFLMAKNQKGLSFTDDASVLEHFGESVGIFPGDERNIKLTFEHDSELLRPHLAQLKGGAPCVSEMVTTSIV